VHMVAVCVFVCVCAYLILRSNVLFLYRCNINGHYIISCSRYNFMFCVKDDRSNTVLLDYRADCVVRLQS